MKTILALSMLSFLVGAAGCGAGPEPSPSAATPSVNEGLASTPGALAVAEKLTSELRQSPASPDTATLPVASTERIHADLEVRIHCNLECIRACGPLDNQTCSEYCCNVIVVEMQ